MLPESEAQLRRAVIIRRARAITTRPLLLRQVFERDIRRLCSPRRYTRVRRLVRRVARTDLLRGQALSNLFGSESRHLEAGDSA